MRTQLFNEKDFERIKLTVNYDWKIIYNKLTIFDPDIHELTEEEFDFYTLGLFTQNMAQIESKSKSLLIDIGWYPDSEIDGEFLLQILPITDGECDWFNPVVEFRTRSLKKLILKIEELMK
ncbi:hypothetical protein DBR39_11660 [Chryseobacterium sp. KBW03]|uniref:hypothetical protein n=1 Tax=Chryseobacterium sp. KBW03 TaxID=2153362 RepID=UPI000F59B563|nr:hypothetical protein [Chryseobacterium sp. KBW03]RQO37545.1 hypothetical protein DBR39_11660 [Chryseobacterium sp. KBW03]